MRQTKREARKSFIALFNEGNFPQAFIIASKYPFLKKTKRYTQLQNHFHSLLKIAAHHIKQKEHHKAQELIGAYARIEEKRLIVKLLLSHGEVFLEFLGDVSKRKLQKSYESVALYEEFVNVPSFVALDGEVESRLEAMEALIDSMECERVDEDFVKQMVRFKEKARYIEAKLKKAKRLKALYEAERFWECYDFVQECDELKTTLLARLLENYFQKRLEEAKGYAQKGEIAKVLESFEPFLQSQAKQKTMEKVLVEASVAKMERLLEEERFLEVQRALFLAVERFGKKEQFVQMQKKFFQKTGVGLVV